jgi:hypothetical protein
MTLIRSKLEYASVVWNSITSTDANKLERIQQRFEALCFFPEIHYCYSQAMEELKIAQSTNVLLNHFLILYNYYYYLDAELAHKKVRIN